MYVFDKYDPMIPVQNNCTPLTKNIIQTKLGHPSTGSPNISVLTIITTMQLISYYVALLKGENIDQPRNLAKSVTVE